MHEIYRAQVRILYSGKRVGNMDERFSLADDVASRRDDLMRQLDMPIAVRMRAHGKDTFVDLEHAAFSQGWNEIEGDGLVTNRGDVALVLLPADCIPLVVYSISSPVRALVHVGRKGAELGVHKKVIDYLFGAYHQRLDDLRFYVGPTIRPASYYFLHIESAQKKDPRWKPFIEQREGNYHIDMLNFVLNDLIAMGFDRDQFEFSSVDTGCDKNYYSHARSVRTGEPEGRNTFAVTQGADTFQA